jgi:putative superfamily III holin-X
MVRSGRPDGADGQPSLGDLVALAAKDISSLIRYEISLAKSELRMDGRRIGMAAALAVIGLSGLCLILILLCFALAYLIVWATNWPIFVGFLITAAACAMVVALALLIAWGRLRKVTGMKMTRKTVMDDIGMLRKADASPNGSSSAVKNPEVSAGPGAKAQIPPARP